MLVHQKTAHTLSFQNLIARERGEQIDSHSARRGLDARDVGSEAGACGRAASAAAGGAGEDASEKKG